MAHKVGGKSLLQSIVHQYYQFAQLRTWKIYYDIRLIQKGTIEVFFFIYLRIESCIILKSEISLLNRMVDDTMMTLIIMQKPAYEFYGLDYFTILL